MDDPSQAFRRFYAAVSLHELKRRLARKGVDYERVLGSFGPAIIDK